MLKESLPEFTELNWTSCLRRYARFVPCEEGPSDFIYSGDMDAFKSLFNLPSDRQWKTAYIEVKSTSRPEKFRFHLSDRQFERVTRIETVTDL